MTSLVESEAIEPLRRVAAGGLPFRFQRSLLPGDGVVEPSGFGPSP